MIFGIERDRQFSIGELANEAGVSIRTIRYYLAEGLLPPAEGGPRAIYTQAHLDRLRLIGQLKNAFLPLKEIRRQLSHLDEAEIHRLAEETLVITETDRLPPLSMPMSMPPPGPMPAPALFPDHRRRQTELREEPSGAADYIANLRTRSGSEPHVRHPINAPHSVEAEPVSWKRIRLGDEAELLIASDVYERRKDKVDWLVDWARKVLS